MEISNSQFVLNETARISPIPLIDIPNTLQSKIAEACAKSILSTPIPAQIWAHRSELALNWLALLTAFHTDSLLKDRTRELMRLKIAAVTNCNTCLLARKSDTVTESDIACLSHDDDRFSPAEHAAMTYAQMFASDFQSIGTNEFDQLQAQYDDAQIVEIEMYCALMLAGGRMMYVQRGQ